MSDAETRAIAARALACLDLTNLDDGCDAEAIRDLCARALSATGKVAAVCVWPRFAEQAKTRLKGTGVAVATVIVFPGGEATVGQARDEAQAAVDTGADEVDLVVPYRALMEGQSGVISAQVESVRQITGSRPLKAILETGVLKQPDLIRAAAKEAIAGGADFIKTSTGKVPLNATPAAARIMLEEIAEAGRPVGLKPSGGIRTVDDAATYLALADEIMGPDWATPATFRFGASGLHTALTAVLQGRDEGPAGEGY